MAFKEEPKDEGSKSETSVKESNIEVSAEAEKVCFLYNIYR